MTAKFLLIWEEIPDNTYWAILDWDSPIAQLARECHGKYINSGSYPDDDPIWKLNEAISTMGDVHRVRESDNAITSDYPIVGFAICGFVA
jgi:hypothetical protein